MVFFCISEFFYNKADLSVAYFANLVVHLFQHVSMGACSELPSKLAIFTWEKS